MIPVLFEPKETNFDHFGIGAMNDCKSCVVTEEENGQYEATLTFPINTKYSEYLEDRNFQIKAKPNDEDGYNIFTIYNHFKDMATGVLHVSARSRSFKLGNRTVKKVVIERETGKQAMQLLHNGMDLESDIQMFSDITTVGSTSFEVENPLTCIKGTSGSLLQTYGGEIKHEPFKLSLLNRRGKDDVTTIRYRKNLTGLKVELDWSGLITRIFPYADIQNNEGQTERIYGNSVDSQYIKNYDGEVYARHIQFTEEQGATNLASLNNVAKKYFTSMNPGVDKPKINISADIVKLDTSEKNKKFKEFRKLNLCDTFSVFHERYKINLSAKVIAIEYDSLSEKVIKLTAGDAKYTFFEEQKQELTEVFKKVPTKSYASVFIDYVTQIISGNDGGHVIWWPKNRPSDLFFCDNPVLEKAKQVLRINKSGIGFSSEGWQGKFKTAWTLDGAFVADFIQTGIIKAAVFEGSFNELGDQLKLIAGALQAWNNGKKIMEMTKKGMQFWNGTSEIGTIGTTDSAGNPFPDLVTAVPLDGNSLVVKTVGDSKYILISPSKGKGFVMASGAATTHFGDFTIRGKTQTYDDVEIKGKLTLNGREVFPGQGGGSSGSSGGQGNNWNGQYPPEVQTDAEKFAWQAWVMLLSLGYSQAAAAGILGNINGEAGPSMNPDIDQIGGPAYGAIQFDGSAYPLVPPATSNGRIYVQNLMKAAGITDDYRQMAPQMKLVNWAMSNGQWIGVVAPTTVSGFKAITDPSQAAYVFEKNFERPRDSHPDRQGYAVYWYNKFKDLKIPQANSDIVSIAKSLLGYFTYQLIHGEAYIGSVANPDRNGVTDCSGYVWLVLAMCGYRVPANMQWYTGSMTSDARGSHNWFQEIAPEQSKAGDVVIYNVGGGAGSNGHTAILLETYRGNETQIIQMGGDGRFSGVNTSTIGYSFGSLLGGDRCIARAVK